MPGLPLAPHGTTHFRPVEQMCPYDSRVSLSDEEAAAAEESLSVYCKPVELYNILQRRALRHPLFLQRCLSYQIQAKCKRRIQFTVSVPGIIQDGLQSHNLFPLYVLLASPFPETSNVEKIMSFRISRGYAITACSEFGTRDQAQANFILPEIRKLMLDAKAVHLSVLFVSFGDSKNKSGRNSFLGDHAFTYLSSKLGGHCLWGKLSMHTLISSWEDSANLCMGHRAEVQPRVELLPGCLERGHLDEENCVRFQAPSRGNVNTAKLLQVHISAQQVGANDRSPYDCYSYLDVPDSSLAHIVRLRAGNVIFNYRYYNNTLQKTEVTEDFTCPFCLVQCGCFKGLRYHLTSSHDLFNFEFWVTEEYQAVNVSVKTDIWRSEVVADGVDPRLQTFSFCSRKRRRWSKACIGDARHVCPDVLKLESLMESRVNYCEEHTKRNGCTGLSPVTITASHSGIRDLEKSNNDCGSNKATELKAMDILGDNYSISGRPGAECSGQIDQSSATHVAPLESCLDGSNDCANMAQASDNFECSMAAAENDFAPAAMLQFSKTRKLSVERTDPRNRALLQKRQFFHSHRAQPMALEQVLSDRDSEDEVDDDIADLEDRRMLDDFVDVTKDEKQIMHLWNSFVRKQRVLADGHILWACEAFTKLHGPDLVRAPALLWCWRLFMIKLWNHSLLDARTMNNCNLILERLQAVSTIDPKR